VPGICALKRAKEKTSVKRTGVCSWLMGVLYNISIPAMVAVSMLTQLTALLLYYYLSTKSAKGN